MTCLDEDTVLAFCAGTLPPPVRARAEEHLAGCDECRILVSAVVRSSFAMPAASLGARPSAETPLLGGALAHEVDPGATHAAGQGAGAAFGAPVRVSAGSAMLDPMGPTTPVRSSSPASKVVSPVAAGDVLAGKYVVERVLGAGGMGVVVAARHTQLEQRVALKFLLPQACEVPGAVARFLQEGKASARISSEHVARVVDTGVLDTGAPYLVMEYLEGQDLGAVLAERRRLPWSEAVAYVLQACEAIAEAHELGIVHRDLKPANLFLTARADGSALVKVLDFGISKVDDASRAQLTSTSMLMGSPRYMSPEQMISAKDVDARTDVWALGVILFELVTGRPLWTADTVQGLCALVTSAPAPPMRAVVPDLPEALEVAVLRALVKLRDGRLASVADLARSLAPIAPPEARTSIERILGVAGRASRGPGRPSHGAVRVATSAPPPAYAPPPSPRVGAAFAVTAAGSSGTGRSVLALAALVGGLFALGVVANFLVRPDPPQRRPSDANANASANADASANANANANANASANANANADADAGVVAVSAGGPASSEVRPAAVPRRAPTRAPAVVSARPSAPQVGPAPVDTSRALVERK